MNFLSLKAFLKLINDFWKKKNTQRDTWQPLGVPRVMLTSAHEVSRCRHHHDASVDLVNIDQVNGQRVHVLAGSSGPRCQCLCDYDRWGPLVSWVKRKREKGFVSVLG